MKNFFELIGRYFMLMSKAFSRPEKFSIYRKRILVEMASLGLNSIGIVAIISVFMGAVITIQMALNLESPFIPKYLIGYATRESMLLEFSSTVVALILGGEEHLFEGRVEGRIIEHETGHEGFGYDPLFCPEGSDRTFAQMTTDEKNALSHRARAVRKLADYLHSIGK